MISPSPKTARRRPSRRSRSCTAAGPSTCSTPPSAPADEGIVLPPSRKRTDDSSGRVLLIVIDDLHFEAEYTPMVRKLVQQIGDQLMHDGDLIVDRLDRPVVHRDRVPPTTARWRWRPSQDSRLRPHAEGDLRVPRVVAGARRHALPRAVAFYSAYNMVDQLEAGQPQAQGRHLHQHRLRLRSVCRGPQQQRPHPGRTLFRPDALPDRRGEPVFQDGRV